MRSHQSERGATLPFSIVTIVLLSIGAIAGLNRVQAESRTTGNQAAEVDVFTMAEAGISRFIAATTAMPGATLDTLITGIPGGSAQVSVQRLRAATPTVNALYVIRSSATSTSAVNYDHRSPAAQRTVAQLAEWRPGSIGVNAAWTSVSGLEKAGGSGQLNGNDQCAVWPAVAGVAVPSVGADGGPGYDQNGGAPVPSGNPGTAYPASDPASFAPLIPVDWDQIVNHGALTPDYTLSSAAAGWPISWGDWPTIYVSGNADLGPGNTGQGLLIVRGNATMNGSFSWNGVIIVGGQLVSSGNQTIQGAILSGLNVQLGEAVPTSDVGSGTKTVSYNSCNVASALEHLSALVAIGNARVDNWPNY